MYVRENAGVSEIFKKWFSFKMAVKFLQNHLFVAGISFCGKFTFVSEKAAKTLKFISLEVFFLCSIMSDI